MKTSRIIAIAALVTLLILVLGLAACGPSATPTPVPPTAVPPTKAPVVPTVPPPVPTVPPPAPTAPPKPTAVPVPPEAKLQVLAIPGNAADTNAITATVSYITDTAAGAAKTTAALYTSGLGNVPIKVPVKLQVSAADPKNSGAAAWSLTKPGDSKSTVITTTKDGLTAMFTPDVAGAYLVGVTLKNAAGLTSVGQYASFNAGTYIGSTAGKCATCHAKYAGEWAKTAHATLFSRELDNQVDGPLGVKPSAAGFITHYSESCVRCHSTGYYPAPYNGSGGYWDAKAAAKWTFPTWKQIDEVFTKKAPSNYAAAPAEVKNMGAIGCEVCHGPASEHVKNGAKVMQASFDSGICGQCHGAAANHSKNWQLANSKHSTGTSFEEINGPARQACTRCHSAEGFASFVANPTNQAAWSTEEGSISCATCHDPHSEANPYQLRVAGKPVEVPFAVTKDVGLSAICYTCHNSRTNAEQFAKGTAGFGQPHYSSAAEMISDVAGVTYGQTLPNSPHGMMVGAAPIANPAYDGKDTSVAQFLFTPAGVAKGNTPGACVTCHMWAPVTSPVTSTLAFKVGGHSFNAVTPDGKEDYGAACKSCHGEVKDFNLKAKADYDGNGKVEGVQDEVKGLLSVVWKALEAKGVKKVDTGYPYATLPQGADAKINSAWFNYRTVYGVMWGAAGPGGQGMGSAVHNMKRSVALLQLSLKDLTGSLPTGMTDATK